MRQLAAAVKNWFDWVSPADVGNNLIAGAITLTLGVVITYFIIERLLKRQERRSWEPARIRLLSTLKRQCEGAIIGWARNTNPPRLELTERGIIISKEILEGLGEALRSELDALAGLGEHDLYPRRPQDYWRAQVHALSTMKESLRLAVDRAQLTLRDDPDLVQAVADLELAYMAVPGLDEHLRALDSQVSAAGLVGEIRTEQFAAQLRLGAHVVVQCLRRFHNLWMKLEEIPGALG
jgi:hypothetical protein